MNKQIDKYCSLQQFLLITKITMTLYHIWALVTPKLSSYDR